jgi:hypothetical protein
MTAEQEVIWECFLMRRERDLEWLWQGQQAGDPLGRKFFTGLGGWLEKCRNAPVDEAPQCLTCNQTFCDPTQHLRSTIQSLAAMLLRPRSCESEATVQVIMDHMNPAQMISSKESMN